MNERVEKRLRDAIGACHWILEFTEGTDFAEYRANYMRRSAVERQIEIIGEALNVAKQLSPDLENVPGIRQAIGTRNRLIHGYDSVDDEIVWDVARNKIPDLIIELNALLTASA
jgi:uncharacterized protein with HEPN domain